MGLPYHLFQTCSADFQVNLVFFAWTYDVLAGLPGIARDILLRHTQPIVTCI
jgi:hypothetical protein